MSKKLSIFTGIGLVIFGALILAGNFVFPMLGIRFRWWQFWRWWPIIVISIGLLITAIPFLARGRRGLGSLFIPGIPILVTGGILLFCSLFDAWGSWEFLWPLEPLALGLGFTFSALWMRSVGLAFPAIIIGLNGLVLAFCNITGWWEAWGVLWTIEPSAVGLALLLAGVRKSNKSVVAVGLGLCGFAAVAAVGMSVILLSGWWLFRFLWPVAIILIGVTVIGLGMIKNRTESDDETPSAPIEPEILTEGSGA
jgi:hypothetical protein